MNRLILYVRPSILIVASAGRLLGESGQATSSLVLRVRPEAIVTPVRCSLRFVVGTDGSPIAEENIQVQAKVRALPRQKIEIVANVTELQGEATRIPAANLLFRGVRTSARSGAESASCSSGSVATASLVSNWIQSGSLTCAVSFFLKPGKYVPGTYTGNVALELVTRYD
jgi:hypothetical protein